MGVIVNDKETLDNKCIDNIKKTVLSLEQLPNLVQLLDSV